MLNRHTAASAFLVTALVSLWGSHALSMYIPDPRRASYEVPDILRLPDRIAVDMTFRPLDPDTESEVYPAIIPNVREFSAADAKPAVEPPDAFTRRLGLKEGQALYWRSPISGAKRWVAVEYIEDRAVALYVDVDGDGTLDGNERIEPADTTTHFTVPAFRRKREGWADFDIKLFLEARHQPGKEEMPTLSWSSQLDLNGSYSRRLPESAFPDWTARSVPADRFSRAVDVGALTAVYTKVRVKDQEQWSVVATERGLARTLFFDIDGDGEVAEQEIIPHAFHEVRFCVPTFMIDTEGAGCVPYRVCLYANGRTAPAWCQGGVWEGPIQLGEKTYRLIVFDRNMNGSFSDVGEDCYTFFSEAGPIYILDEVMGFGSTRSIPTHALQRLVQIEGVNLFSMGALTVDAETGTTGHVMLTRDAEMWGSVQVSLPGDSGVTVASGELNVGKSDRTDINFSLDLTSTEPRKLPAWNYAVRSTRFSYRAKTGDTWSTDCRGGTFNISPDTALRIELGAFRLRVCSKDFPDNVKIPVVKRGTELELTREVTGGLGEVYTRFRNETRETWIGSTLRILDPDGKEIAVESLGYG